jgi:hypothetical protein
LLGVLLALCSDSCIVGAAIEDVVVNKADPKEAPDKATADPNEVPKITPLISNQTDPGHPV